MTPMTFLSRLAALIPTPRANLVTYHGELAPAAPHRQRIVPAALHELESTCHHPVQGATPEIKVEARHKRESRMLWSQTMRRGLGLDVLTSQHCGGKRTVLKVITDPKAITRILDHLDLATSLPPIAPARAPPGSESLFEL